MLFWLPVATVPLLVAARARRRRAAPTCSAVARIPSARSPRCADAWYALGPALVLLAAGEPAADDVSWAVVALALASRSARSTCSRRPPASGSAAGSPPALQLRVIVVRVPDRRVPDPGRPGGRGAGAARRRPPSSRSSRCSACLAAFAHDRRARIDELTSRLDELQEERAAPRRRRSVASARRPARASTGRRCSSSFCARRSRRSAPSAAGPARAGRRGGGGRGRAAASARWTAAAAAPRPAPPDGLRRGRGRGRRRAARSATGGRRRRPRGRGPCRPRRSPTRRRALFDYLAGADVRGHGERRAARADQPRGARRRAHRAGEPPPLPGVARARGRAHAALPPAARARDDRHRPLQVGQRHLRPPAGRRGAARAWPARSATSPESPTSPARYGGEELAVVLPDTDLDGAFAAGEQIRRAVERLRVEWPGGAPLRVTVSVGVAAGEPQTRAPR